MSWAARWVRLSTARPASGYIVDTLERLQPGESGRQAFLAPSAHTTHHAGPACRSSTARSERVAHAALPDGLVCIAAWSKTEARSRERRIEDRGEHLIDSLLGHPVGDRGRFANSPSRRLPPSDLGIPTLLAACGRYRPASICSRCAGQCWRAWAGKSSTVTPSIPGAPSAPYSDFSRCHARSSLSLNSTACSRSWVVASSCFKARCAGRRCTFPGLGRRCVRGRHRLLLVSRCSALQRPDSWPPTQPSRDCHCPVAPLAVQISPGKNANYRGTSAALNVG